MGFAMRHRKVKGKEEVFERAGERLITEPALWRGRWQSLFPKPQPLCLEIGSGKGQFLSAMAALHPEWNFLACEGLPDVYVRILEKMEEGGIENLRVIGTWMAHPADWFSEGELSRIYINFCDPWPKKRHEKRRLTNRRFLEEYQKVLEKGGRIEFKTDSAALFDYSLAEFSAAGLNLLAQSRDLYAGAYAGQSPASEYEEKFASAGRPIYFARLATPK